MTLEPARPLVETPDEEMRLVKAAWGHGYARIGRSEKAKPETTGMIYRASKP